MYLELLKRTATQTTRPPVLSVLSVNRQPVCANVLEEHLGQSAKQGEEVRSEGHDIIAKEHRNCYASKGGEICPYDFRDGNYSSLPDKYKPTLQELADILGDEWDEVSSKGVLLKAWNEAIITNRLIADNIRPIWFIHPAFCLSCGPIFLDYIVEEAVVGCPWCFARPDGS